MLLPGNCTDSLVGMAVGHQCQRALCESTSLLAAALPSYRRQASCRTGDAARLRPFVIAGSHTPNQLQQSATAQQGADDGPTLNLNKVNAQVAVRPCHCGLQLPHKHACAGTNTCSLCSAIALHQVEAEELKEDMYASGQKVAGGEAAAAA